MSCSYGADLVAVASQRVADTICSVLPLMVCFLPSFVLLGVVPVVGGIIFLARSQG